MSRDGVANFHVTIGYQGPINQELHQSPLLFKRRVSSAALDPLAKRRDGLHHPRQVLESIYLTFELLFLGGQSMLFLCDVLTSPLLLW